MPLEWNPEVYECPNCKDLIYSERPGQFRSCSCYSNEIGNMGLAIDQTEHYLRLIGNLDAVHKGKLSDN